MIKHVINNNGGTATAPSFTMSVTGSSPSPATFAGAESPGTNIALNAGSYNVTESGPSGYTDTYSPDCSSTISAGETKTCTVTNDDQAARLIVIKHVVNDNGGTLNAGNFTMHISGTAGSATFAGVEDPGVNTQVNAGTFNVTEDAVTGYTSSTSGDCSGTIGNGETKTCTITNDDVAPTLTLVKHVTNNSGGNAAVADFPLFIDGNPATSGVAYPVTANAVHTATENNLSGYTPSSWSGDCAAGGTITLLPGENKTCHITNDDVTASITLIKNVINDDGGNAGVNDFGLTIGATGVTSGQTLTVQANTSYALNEAGLAGYNFVSMTGDAKCPQALGGSVSLNEGEDITCTITNDDQAGNITIVKNTIGGDGSFNFAVSGPTPMTPGVTTTGGSGSSGPTSANAGNYDITETVPTGWDFTSAACDKDYAAGTNGVIQVSVILGQTTTCIFTNTKRGSITVAKNANPGDTGDQFNIVLGGDASDSTLLANGESDTFSNLVHGIYNLCEVYPTGNENKGWSLENAYCDGQPVDCNTAINLDPGQNINCVFNNIEDGKIQVLKNVDLDNDGDYLDANETNMTDWNWNINDAGNYATGSDVQLIYPGNYTISEVHKNNFHVVNLNCNGTDYGAVENQEITVNPGENIICTFENARDYGMIIVDKVTDPTGVPDQFTINLNQGADPIHTYTIADQDAPQSFAVPTGGHSLVEDLANNPGWNLSGIQCSTGGDEIDGGELLRIQTVDINPANFLLKNGQIVTCTFTNTFVTPELKIDKSNDATGDKNPGDSVKYTLTIKAPDTNQSNVENVQVTDLPPAGFVYVSDSAAVNSSVRGALAGALTHVYASPGVWSLGTMVPGEVVTLTYDTVISDTQDAGLYKDLAWAAGTDLINETVQATYGDPEIFVGTQVAVVVPEQHEVALLTVEKTKTKTETKHKTRRVLGAELPATGASPVWPGIAAILFIIGFNLIMEARKREKRNFNKTLIKILVFSVLSGGLLLLGGNAKADTINDTHLSVKIEQPDSPQFGKDFKIGFVALDIDGDPITVKCYEEGLGLFDTYNSATSGNCDVSKAGITADGDYKFYVTADAGHGINQTDSVTVKIDLSAPETPLNYSRTDVDACNKQITFTTAAIGDPTDKIELYRSTTQTFVADPAVNKVGETATGLGLNFSGTISDNVAPADCSLKYYYAIRAVDAEGNGSGFVGDENVHVTTKTKHKTSTRTITIHPAAAGAIPTAGGGAAGGAVGGAEAGGEAQPGAEEEGQVLGEEMETQGQAAASWLKKNKWLLISILIVILIGAYAYRKNKRKNQPAA